MSDQGPSVGISIDGHVATVELRRPPHNFFDIPMISALADAFEELEDNRDCRAIVLASQGTAFCAGAHFVQQDAGADDSAQVSSTATPAHRSPRALNPLYAEGIRLFSCGKPVVAAVHGPAVGGGLGLALVADFRVTCAEARFTANFTRLGFHPGFGLSVTLPRLVGVQRAAMLLYTGRRISGSEAVAMGLADMLVPQDQVLAEARKLAREIATSAPLAVQSTRATLRQGLVEQIRVAVARESMEQNAQFKTADFREGVAAMAARREPRFSGE